MRTMMRGVLLALAIAALSGCGSSGPGAATTSCGVASSASANPSATPNAAGLVLTATEFPCNGPSLTQVSDGALNGAAGSDQRVFANSDNTFRVEDDVFVDISTSVAQTDYAAFRDAAKKQVATVSASSSPAGLGTSADEFLGTAADGHSIIAITWVDGRVIVAMLFEASGQTVDPTFVQQSAQAQNDIILNAGPQ
jgi:hypothetical protein